MKALAAVSPAFAASRKIGVAAANAASADWKFIAGKARRISPSFPLVNLWM
jgi:hypothetical protein